jgi:DNA-binding transcriptional ArsR family regulator
MSWRIHFTDADLAKIEVGEPAGPLAETVLAMSFLRCPLQPPAMFGAWREQVRDRFTSQLRPLATLVPPGSRGLDLYTLIGAAPTIESGIAGLLALPAGDLLAELEFLDQSHRLPRSAWAVAEPGGEARYQLADAIDASYRALVHPYWAKISAELAAVQASWCQSLARGGGPLLLTALQNRRVHWRPPVLELNSDRHGAADLHLDGRGLAIVPSVFAGTIASVHLDGRDPAARPAIRMPVAGGHRSGQLSRPRPPQRPAPAEQVTGQAALAALMGRTRAVVLAEIAAGCTTTGLASRCGISLAAASQHATVLRNAGLVVTRREGSAVRHTLTALGEELLRAN